MELPKKIRVASRDIRVIEMSVHEANAQNIDGHYSGSEGCIRIDTSLDNMHVMTVFIHEVLHAIFDGYCMQDGDDEERTVSVMAVGLTQVLRDNPSLLGMLNSAVAVG